jgi:hypothetical protein
MSLRKFAAASALAVMVLGGVYWREAVMFGVSLVDDCPYGAICCSMPPLSPEVEALLREQDALRKTTAVDSAHP